MPNQAVTLLLVAKTEKGWRRMAVAFGRNGKIRPTTPKLVMTRSISLDPIYVLRHLEGSKTVWTNAGDNATDALTARDRQQHVRQAKNLAVKTGITVVEKDDARHTLLSLRRNGCRSWRPAASVVPSKP